MKTFSKTFFFIIFATIILVGCDAEPPNISFVNSSTPTVTSTPFPPTSTSTPSPTPTPTITFTPTPSVPTSCSDAKQIKMIVDAFLEKRGYNSYEAYLKTLPEFSCKKNECTYIPTDTYFNHWYQTATLRGTILGAFETQDIANSNNGQTCLLFASKDFPEPLPILGAIRESERYIVAVNELGKRLFTRAMTKEKFFEWLSLHEGRIINLGIVLHLYDTPTYERLQTNPGRPYRDHYIKELSSIILLQNIYPNKFANTDFNAENVSEIYQYNKKLLNNILEKYDVLYPTNVSYVDGWELDNTYFAENPFIYKPETIYEKKSIYEDYLSFGFKENYIYISDGDNYILDASNAYRGNNAIRLKVTKNFVGITLDSWDFPISIDEYDTFEFYVWTRNDDFRLYVRGNYSELYDNSDIADVTEVPVYESQPTWVDFSNVSGYEHLEFAEAYYSWLGVRPPMPPESPEGWMLIRVPVSAIERNPLQKIQGISFEFIFPSVPSNRILLDEIRFVSSK